MFAKVIDGQNNNKQPHVLKKGANSDFTSDKTITGYIVINLLI